MILPSCVFCIKNGLGGLETKPVQGFGGLGKLGGLVNIHGFEHRLSQNKLPPDYNHRILGALNVDDEFEDYSV